MHAVDDIISKLSAKEQSELLESHIFSIYELLDVDKLYPNLCREGLLNYKEKNKLTKYGRSRESKISKLIEILRQKGTNAIVQFINCLGQTQDDANHKKLYESLCSYSQHTGMFVSSAQS